MSTTSPSWAPRAAKAINIVLLDHCHLEKKAASTALSLIFRYPEHAHFAEPLSSLAREELRHFEEVLKHLQRLNIKFERQRPSPYAGKLLTVVRTKEPDRLLDTLICCAFIEARSCERMQLLSEVLDDTSLVKLYKGLLAAEARHHTLYVDLAKSIFDASSVDQRIIEIGQHEAEVIASNPQIPRLHNQ